MTHNDASYVGELDVGLRIGQLVVMRLLLWSPYVIGQTIKLIFLPCDFYLSSCFLFLLSFFPRLISAVGDWMSTIFPHMVWP